MWTAQNLETVHDFETTKPQSSGTDYSKLSPKEKKKHRRAYKLLMESKGRIDESAKAAAEPTPDEVKPVLEAKQGEKRKAEEAPAAEEEAAEPQPEEPQPETEATDKKVKKVVKVVKKKKIAK